MHAARKKEDTEKESLVGKYEYLFPALFCLVYFILAVSTASNYGITWDEVDADWYIAERNLNYLLSFDKIWLDFNYLEVNWYPEVHPKLFLLIQPWSTMYFGNLLSAIGCKLLFPSPVHDAILAHHIPNFLLVTGVLAAMFYLVRNKLGLLVAMISLFSIAFQPRFWADTHFNTKDIPFACLIAFTLLAARRGILARNARWIVIASILLGLTAATKLNAALIPVILLFWLLVSYNEIIKNCKLRGEKDRRSNKRYFMTFLIVAPVVAFISFVVVWPYMWFDSIVKLKYFLAHYLYLAKKGKDDIQWDTLLLFLSVQPPAVLLFGGIGIVLSIYNVFKGNNRELLSFLLIWFLLPVIRMLLPRMYNFDGVRHFIEYAIPFGALVGIGTATAFRWVIFLFEKGKVKSKLKYLLSGVIIAAPFITWMVTIIQIHPYEITYFNFIIGGLPGAQKRWDEATDYWGSSYRQGVLWLNENAENGAIIIAPLAGDIVESTQRLWMRRDLQLINVPYKADTTPEELFKTMPISYATPVYALYITRTGWYDNFIRQSDSTWELKHVIEVDGAPILKILKTKFAPTPSSQKNNKTTQ